MNIHFTDIKLFEKLKLATLAKVRVGSYLYGNNNENSDQDWLYIYATSEAEINSLFHTNHQLQYKEDGIDHNFVSLHTFIKNIINGDSTINYEVIQSDILIGTELSWLVPMKNIFNTYNIIKSYNGLAKRDCKHFSKGVTDYDKKKRLGHIIRGYIYADMINKEFNFNKANSVFIDTINRLEQENNINLNTVKAYSDMLDEQRKELNKRLDNKTLELAKNFLPIDGLLLNSIFKTFVDMDKFKSKQLEMTYIDMKLFINAFENWVSYE